MKLKNILFGLFIMIFAFPLFSQTTPGWEWAKRGGGPGDFNHSPFWSYSFERIVDLAVDADDNYYFLAEISGFQYSDLVDYDGQTLHTYNGSDNSRDIYMFSTDNDGNFRWDKMIGGGRGDHAASINLDAENNVYVSGTAQNRHYTSPSVHFDTDTIKTEPELDVADPMNKSAFLIKYDQNGNYQWLQEPEGVNDIYYGWTSYNAFVMKTIVDPDGTSHSLIFFGPGTHLDGQLTVSGENQEEERIQQATIVNYNADGVLEDFFTIDMKPANTQRPYNYQLAHDPGLDRYYIGDGVRDFNDTLSINGYGADTGLDDKAFYLAAVNNQGEVLWYHQNHNSAPFYPLGDLQLDEWGNIYLSGVFSAGSPNHQDNFAGYEFTMSGDVGSGEISPFLIKLDSEGNLLWGTNSESYSPFPGESISIDGDDVYLGLGILGNEWNGLDIPGPNGAGLVPDPIIVKFNAQTGEALNVISTPDVSIYNDRFMALGVDSEHNLIGGGFFGNHLFYDKPFAIFNSGGPSDFFVSKYATGKEPNPCAEPTDLAVDNIGAETVHVTWTPGGEEPQWEVAYGSAGFDPETEGTSITVSAPEATLENLDPETDYIVYVRALCGDDGQSSWAGSVSFTTGELSVKGHHIEGLKIHPNPTGGILHIESKTGLESYTLYDLQGKILKEERLDHNQIDLSTFENGMYILSITDTKGNTQRVKIVKK